MRNHIVSDLNSYIKQAYEQLADIPNASGFLEPIRTTGENIPTKLNLVRGLLEAIDVDLKKLGVLIVRDKTESCAVPSDPNAEDAPILLRLCQRRACLRQAFEQASQACSTASRSQQAGFQSVYQYTKLKLHDRGGEADIWQVKTSKDDVYALKEHRYDDVDIRSIEEKAKLLNALNNENIIRFKSIFLNNDNKVCVLMEDGLTSLEKILSSKEFRQLAVSDQRNIVNTSLVSMYEALNAIRSIGLCQTDPNLGNWVVTTEGIKAIDVEDCVVIENIPRHSNEIFRELLVILGNIKVDVDRGVIPAKSVEHLKQFYQLVDVDELDVHHLYEDEAKAMDRLLTQFMKEIETYIVYETRYDFNHIAEWSL